MTPSAHREHGSFLRRHAGLLILGGLGLLLVVIVLGQLVEDADIEAWLSEQSAGVAPRAKRPLSRIADANGLGSAAPVQTP